MTDFVPIGTTEEFPEDGGRTVTLGERKIAVFRVGEAFHAIDDTCLHRGGSLGRGELDGCVVSCPLHGWEWDVATGELCFQRSIRLDRYEVRVEDGRVFLAASPRET